MMINPSSIKGIDVFVGLARRFPRMAFGAVPSWATTSSDRRLLEREPNVHLVEPSEDLDAVFATARVLLVPSRWQEALGQVVVDAMVRGVPVIASDVGGLREAKLGVEYVVPVTAIDAYRDELDDAWVPVPVVPDLELTAGEHGYRKLAEASRAAAMRYWRGLSLVPFYRFFDTVDRRPAGTGR
jgi:glycosyltransferase involved in cell wall biosynthesis